MSTRTMVEGALLTAFTVVLSFIGIYVPLLGFFASLFVAVPIIILVIRQGLRIGIFASVVSAFLVAVLAQPYQALVVLFAAGLVGLAIGGAISEGFSSSKTLVVGTIFALIAEISLLGASILISGIDPLKLQVGEMDRIVESSLSFYKTVGVGPEAIELLRTQLQSALKVLRLTIPGAIVSVSAVSTYINYLMTRSVMVRLGRDIGAFPPLRSWKLPGWIGIGLGIGLILFAYNLPSDIQRFARPVGANILYVFGGLTVLQGLAIVASLIDRFGKSVVTWASVLLFFLNPSLFFILVGGAGALDPLIDFRKIRK